jgi:hypothetical protein
MSANAQITSAGSGNWNDGATWVGNTVPVGGDNVVISSGHSVNLNATSLACNDLSISGTLEFSQTIAIDLTVNGNISILTGGVFRVLQNTLGLTTPNGGIAHSLNLFGDLTHSGTTFDFRTGSAGTTLAVCNITFSGTSTSTLNVPYVSSSNGEFNHLTVNKTSPGKVVLASNIVTAGGSGTGPAICNSGINFANGIVETGSFMLAYQGSTAAQVTGGSSNSYVIGKLARGMSTSAGSSKEFIIGDANGYRPLNLRSTTSGSATGHLAIVKCVSGNANTGSSTFAGGIDKVSEVRYYELVYSNALGGAANMSFDLFKVAYGSDDGVVDDNTDLLVAYSTHAQARGTWTGITQTTPHSTTVTNPPTQITPDAITPVSVASGQSLFVVLARATGTTTNPLPIELQSFTATSRQGIVELVWSTATETNNAGFNVEKNSYGTWQSLGFVEGNGTTNAPKQYSFVEKNVETGSYSYRLKQVDRDGNFEYSQSVELNVVGAPTVLALNGNYPNPFNPATNISFTVPFEGQATVKVFDVLGKEIAMVFNDVAMSGKQYSVPFYASSLPSGIYFSQLEFGGQRIVKKMMLMK